VNRLVLLRRLVGVLLVGLLIAFTAQAVVGERGYLDVGHQAAERDALAREVEFARESNARIAAEIAELNNGGPLLETLARERLGYIRPGEVTFLFPPESSDPPAPAPPGR
jgi:cell division protein FtsB